MRIFIGCIIYNILLIIVLFYVVFLSNNDIKMSYLKDLTGLNEEEGIIMLSDFQIAVEYIESDLEKAKIVYTEPSSGELVYDNQMVTLYVSKGYVK